LRNRLSAKVKDEQIKFKEYLVELAKAKAKDIYDGISEIKNILGKPPASLASYVDYVAKVEHCNVMKESLEKMKKFGLEDMKAALSKYKSKDEGYGNASTT
jgi:tetrahydromethanopterin S-methyltransferase subunit H